MKRIIFLSCIGTIALSLTALGAPNKQGKSAKGGGKAPAMSAKAHGPSVSRGPSMSHGGSMKAQRSFSPARVQRAPAMSSGKMHGGNNAFAERGNVQRSNKMKHANAASFRNDQVAAARTSKANARAAKVNGRVARQNAQIANANASAAIANNQQFARGKDRGNNRSFVNGNAVSTQNQRVNGVVTNQAFASRAASAPIVNNWQDVGGQNYTAFRDYRRHWHDRSWWRSNYTNIILVGGGYWAWNNGYWYPAWGYDSAYSYYPYDGPIYGYRDLTPDQIVVNVQTQLRDEGYYVGAIDGLLGPQTRRAIAAFQADHGLAVTSAVDEPTLATLGLT